MWILQFIVIPAQAGIQVVARIIKISRESEGAVNA